MRAAVANTANDKMGKEPPEKECVGVREMDDSALPGQNLSRPNSSRSQLSEASTKNPNSARSDKSGGSLPSVTQKPTAADRRRMRRNSVNVPTMEALNKPEYGNDPEENFGKWNQSIQFANVPLEERPERPILRLHEEEENEAGGKSEDENVENEAPTGEDPGKKSSSRGGRVAAVPALHTGKLDAWKATHLEGKKDQ